MKNILIVISLLIQIEFGYSQNKPNWHFTNTGCNHMIILPSPVQQIGYIQLMPGDFIGAFYDSSGTLACGSGAGASLLGGSIWTGQNLYVTTWKDDILSPVKDGFYEGELFQWKLWRLIDNTEYYLKVTYDLSWANDSLFVTNGFSSITQIEPITSNNLELKNWNHPLTACDFSDTTHISIVIINDDSLPVANFTVSYSIDNGITWVTETVTKSIQPNSSMTYTFNQTADMSYHQNYNCIATVNLIGDINTGNDSLFYNLYGLNLGEDIETELPDTVILSASNHFITYLWSNGSTNETINVQNFGQYSVTITTGTCTLSDFINVIDIDNIDQDDIRDFSLFPNPANNFIFITGIVTSDVKIFSLTGKVLLISKGGIININSLPPGAYICHIGNFESKFLILR